jgi:methionyl aminopeptidase
MIYCKTHHEVTLIKKSSLLVSATLQQVAKFLKPGVTTLEVNSLIEDFIVSNGAIPSFKNYHGFPFASCISVNDAVVHGFPNDYIIADGDIISVDVGVFMNDFHGDSAYTFAVGNVPDTTLNLLKITKESLYKGIELAYVGKRIGDIGYAVQNHCETNGYGVVRELVGHGLGRELHEDPQVPNYGRRGDGKRLLEGMVIAIEPMINIGKKEVKTDDDGWTIRTADGTLSAHFEHTICVKKNKAEILSSFEPIEEALKQNPFLVNI